MNKIDKKTIPSFSELNLNDNWSVFPSTTNTSINSICNLAEGKIIISHDSGSMYLNVKTQQDPIPPDNTKANDTNQNVKHIGVRNGIYHLTTNNPNLYSYFNQGNLAISSGNPFITFAQEGKNASSYNQQTTNNIGIVKDHFNNSSPNKSLYVFNIDPNLVPYLAISNSNNTFTINNNNGILKTNFNSLTENKIIINSNEKNNSYLYECEVDHIDYLNQDDNKYKVTFNLKLNSQNYSKFTYISGEQTPDKRTTPPGGSLAGSWEKSIDQKFCSFFSTDDTQNTLIDIPWQPKGFQIYLEPNNDKQNNWIPNDDNTSAESNIIRLILVMVEDGNFNPSNYISKIKSFGWGVNKDYYQNPTYEEFRISMDPNGFSSIGGFSSNIQKPMPYSDGKSNNFTKSIGYISGGDPKPKFPDWMKDIDQVYWQGNDILYTLKKAFTSNDFSELQNSDSIIWGVFRSDTTYPQNPLSNLNGLPGWDAEIIQVLYPNYISGDMTMTVNAISVDNINGSDLQNPTGATIFIFNPGSSNKPKQLETRIFLIEEAPQVPIQTKLTPYDQQQPMFNLNAQEYLTINDDINNIYGGGEFFLPGKFPAGDYSGTTTITIDHSGVITKTVDFPIILTNSFGNGSGSDTKNPQANMTADQCRWCWRLSHYSRWYSALSNSNQNTVDSNLLTVTESSAVALAYSAIKTGGLSLGVTLWSLSKTAGDDNSADMVPPLLSSVDSLIINKITSLNNDIVNPILDIPAIYKDHNTLLKYRDRTIYGYFLTLPGNSSKQININVTEDQAINAIRAASSNDYNRAWPFYDSITGGGQQIGLAGSNMGCILDLYNTDYGIMFKYDIEHLNTNQVIQYQENIDQALKNLPHKFTTASLTNLFNAYLLLLYRGNGFLSFSDWPSNSNDANDDLIAGECHIFESGTILTYASLIGSKAYFCNLRIRDINISVQNELAFGNKDDNYQPMTEFKNGDERGINSWINGITNSNVGTDYIPTFFPIFGIPDSGWGAITVEIFSYQGIAAVIRNDYKTFCRWHRCFYYLLYVQNGGNMFNFSSKGDPIYSTEGPLGGTKTPKPKSSDQLYFVPSYCNYDANTESWYGVKDDLNKNYTVFKDTTNSSLGWPVDQNTTGSQINTTSYWANRWDPYRGQGISYAEKITDATRRVQWSTPSYCMGYSPVWVAAGKTDTSVSCYPYNNSLTPGVADKTSSIEKYPRPIAEALNPYFSNEAGLYSASDGDQNICIAYILASLKWKKPPPDDVSEIGVDEDYDCDVADFKGVLEAYNQLGKSTDTQFVWQGKIDPTTGLPKIRKDPESTSLLNKIGYGIHNDGKQIKDPNGNRCTTWNYMVEAISNTLVSQNGSGWSGNYGNFAEGGSIPGHRIVTLGHDTGGSPIKVDYSDPRLYQYLSQKFTTFKDEWEKIFNHNNKVMQSASGDQSHIN